MSWNPGLNDDEPDKPQYRAHLRQLLLTVATAIIATSLVAAFASVALVKGTRAATPMSTAAIALMSDV